MGKINEITIKMYSHFFNFRSRQRGAISLEYALIGGVIIALAILITTRLMNLGHEVQEQIPERL